MKYGIELRFDSISESVIRHQWDEAADYYGSDYLVRNRVIPHIALLVGDVKLIEFFKRIEFPKESIRLTGFGYFMGGLVCYRKAEVSARMIDFQTQIYHAALFDDAAIDPHYRPKAWIPHCTIAQGCTKNLGLDLTISGLEVTVRSGILVRYPPTKLLGEKLANVMSAD